jgi:hypothetical protein
MSPSIDIQGASATTGEGLHEGLNWVHAALTGADGKKALVEPVKEVINSVQPQDDDSSAAKPSNKPNDITWWSMVTTCSYFKTSSYKPIS